MATANRRPIPWAGIVLSGAALLLAAWWLLGDTARAYGQAGTGYAAKNACACRHISGRELSDCREDFVAGMGLIMLSEDDEERSVTASLPLIADNTAYYREGFGCVLEPWEN